MNLIPISEIIDLAKKRGIFLGRGTPQNRIAYFVKLGLIPHAVRKTNPRTGKIEAHFPISILEQIEEINHRGTKKVLFPDELVEARPNPSTPLRFATGALLVLVLVLTLLNYSPLPKILSENMINAQTSLRNKISDAVISLISNELKKNYADLALKVNTTREVLAQKTSNKNLAIESGASLFLPTNLMINSSFEAGITGYSLISQSGSFNTQVIGESIHSGTLGLKFEDPACAFVPGSCQLGVSQPKVTTINGRDYAFSVWVRVNSLNKGSDPKLRIGLFGSISARDPNYLAEKARGELRSRYFRTYTRDKYRDFHLSDLNDNEWVRLSAQFSDVPLGKYPIIQVVDYKGGKVYVDDVSLNESSSKIGEGNSSTPSFEQTNIKLADNAIIADSYGNLYPNSPLFSGSIGTDSVRFSKLYLTKFTVDAGGAVTAGGGINASSFTTTGTITSTSSNGSSFGGALTVTGNLAVNGGSITTSATTGNLFNTSATTLNIGGAATTVSLGATSGTTTINNYLSTGGITSYGDLSITATSGSLALTLNSSTTAFNVQSSLFDIDTTNSRVGIGTASPSYKLDVSGTLNASGATTLGSTLSVTGATTLSSTINSNTFTSTALTFAGSSPNISASTTNTPLTINANGTGTITLASASTGNVQFFSSSNILTSAGALTLAGGITTSGNLLFGTTNTYDIGSSSGNRPRYLWMANNIILPNNIGLQSWNAANSTQDDLIKADTSNVVQLGSTTFTGVKVIGNMTWNTDNTYDIGASGATRPRTGYFGTSVFDPLVVGGTGTTSTLTLKSTSGVGTTGADIIFQTGNNGATEAMRILNSGNVGIGATNPAQKLEVSVNSAGDSVQAPALRLSNLNTSGIGPSIEFFSGFDSIVKGRMAMYASGTSGGGGAFRLSLMDEASKTMKDRIMIDNAGNVGIGTTAPGDVLHIVKNAGNPGMFFERTGAATGKYRAGIIVDGAGSIGFGIAEDGVATGGLFVRQTSGRIGIGTNLPSDMLDVAGNLVFHTDNSYDIGSSGAVRPRTGYYGTSLVIGSPTGGDKGAGTINIAADIYKNNTAYTNPDYAFEKFYTGSITKFANNPGASTYQGLLSLGDVESFAKTNYELPRIASASGIFQRGDVILEKMEEAYLYLFNHEHRIVNLESSNKNLLSVVGLPTPTPSASPSPTPTPTSIPLPNSILSRLDSLEKFVLGTQTASPSAILNTKYEILDTLTVSGKTTVNHLGITGSISSGLLNIKGLDNTVASGSATINTLSNDLYLQNLGAGGVNFLNGKVLIDKSGNLIAKKYNIDTADSAASAVGRGVIKAGTSSITISTTTVTAKSEIFVTLRNKTNNQPLVVTSQTAGTGFTVEVEQPVSSDIQFSWWIVN